MPFPATMTLVTVAIQWDLPPDGGARGYVDFTAPYPLLGAADGSIIPPFTQRAHLTAAGTGSIRLPATNDPQWSPTGWAYTVSARIGGEPIPGTLQLDYQTTSVQLADLLQVDGAAVTGTSYLLTSQRSVASGVAGLDADGDVINAAGEKVGEAAGGGISETIVNAKGDLIAATANDTVTRLPTGTNGQVLTAASGETTGLAWDTLTATDITDSTSVGRSVLTAADAAAGRTAIGAGTSSLALGSTSSTAAAGDHTHIGVYQPLDSDLTTIAGLTATTDNIIQSVAGAWASRTPTQVKAALAIGISDVTSLQTSLDGKADESVLTAKGDLYVATAASTLARLPVGSNDQVLTADSGQAAGVKWATPSGGGSITVAHGYVTSGDITPQATASFAPLTGGPTFSIAAVAGDRVEFEWSALKQPTSGLFWDVCVLVGGSAVRFASSGSGTASVEGDPSLYPDVASFRPHGNLGMILTCASGDLSGGNVTFGVAVIAPGGAGKLFASTNYPLRYRITNYGQ